MDISKYTSEYLRPEDVGQGIVVVIRSAGEEVEGKFGVKVEFEIEMAGGVKKTWTPNKTTLRELQDDLGTETSRWVGREVKLTVMKVPTPSGMKDAIFGEAFNPQQVSV